MAAHPDAAYALADDLSLVESMGVLLAEICPARHSYNFV